MLRIKMLTWELLRCINGYINHPAKAIWGAEYLGTILEYLASRWRYSAHRPGIEPGNQRRQHWTLPSNQYSLTCCLCSFMLRILCPSFLFCFFALSSSFPYSQKSSRSCIFCVASLSDNHPQKTYCVKHRNQYYHHCYLLHWRCCLWWLWLIFGMKIREIGWVLGSELARDLLDVNKVTKNKNILTSIHCTIRPSVITAATSHIGVAVCGDCG